MESKRKRIERRIAVEQVTDAVTNNVQGGDVCPHLTQRLFLGSDRTSVEVVKISYMK